MKRALKRWEKCLLALTVVALLTGAATVLGPITTSLITATVAKIKTLNNVQICDQYASNQSCATAAGVNGAVIKPPNSANTDAYQDTNPVFPAIDLSHGTFGITQTLETSYPKKDAGGVSLPLGDDLWLRSNGAADVHIINKAADTTSTTTAAIGTQNITVGTTATYYTAASIIIDPNGANEETISSGSWSIIDATTFHATFTKTHAQPYTVRQVGAVFFDTGLLKFQGDGKHNFVNIWDSLNNSIMQLPVNTSGSFPDSAVKWNAAQTGLNGGTKDVLFRNNTSSSGFKILNAANTALLFNLTEIAGGALLALGNPTNTPLTFNVGSTDLARILCGGTVPGCMFYGSNGGTGSNGIVAIRNNSVDDTESFRVTTSTQITAVTKLTVGGGSTLSSVNLFTASLTPTAAAQNSITEEVFTVTGVNASDKCSLQDRPTAANSATPTTAHVTGTNTVNIIFINPTAGSLTPTAGSFSFLCVR